MTDDVIHSTQYYLKYINRATLANLQHRPLKLGRLIVPQEKTHVAIKVQFPWQLTLFQSLPTRFQHAMLEKRLTYLYACWIMPKVARNALGRPGTQYVTMVMKRLDQYEYLGNCVPIPPLTQQ